MLVINRYHRSDLSLVLNIRYTLNLFKYEFNSYRDFLRRYKRL